MRGRRVVVEPEREPLLPSRRRDPYPVSPVIGPEGERACAEIVAAARGLFARRGYHGTSILAITEATGRSDTAFYQYFQSKIELFALFYEQLGRDLVRHFRGQRVIEPGPAGLTEFRAWLEGLDDVLRRHSPVFAAWPLVADDALMPEDPSEQYLHVLAEEMRPRLALAGTGPVDTRVLAIAIISLMQWTHVVLDPRRPGVLPPESSVHATLATIIHSSLFPREAGAVGAVGADGDPPPWPDLLLDSSTDRADPLGAWRETAPLGLRRRVTRRAEPTIRRILAAANQAFERGGLAGTSVDDITAEAGVAHGTFYQYWEDRYAIFATLAHQAAVDICTHLDDLLRAEDESDILAWIDRWLDVLRRRGPTLHVWTTEVLPTAPLQRLSRQLRTHLDAVTARLLARWAPGRSLDPSAAAIVLWVLLGEFPYHAWQRHPVLDRDDVHRSLALLLVGGLLGARTPLSAGGPPR
ncbi:transcriptional regulator, TetR family [Frankia torreyi]|uniref:Transcriptional regulator, TetR family n=1 Tax=Frankia torreyi TaxID=1856 RepID=A0A0D8BMZ8_9ACTN|nr:transcriptional regulator, TetR family [Frankia torreyi]KQC37135.1 TetR family transcriptional regulator [Frankia sp. ACN1ag]